MVFYSMSVSVDGFVADRDGSFDWSGPDDEQFGAHLEEVQGLGTYLLGRRLYEAMRVWETDPSLRSDPARDAFADTWCALPKVVFSRTLDAVEGNARLARGTLAEEVAAAREDGGGDVSIGGADLGRQAFEQGLLDELRMFRYPVVVGGGTPYLPAVEDHVRLELVRTRTFASRVVLEVYSDARGRSA